MRVTASGVLPAIKSFFSGVTYKTCYAVSYGIVFPTALVARAIPKENAAAYGLIDGAHAAIDMVKEMRAKSLSRNTQTPPCRTTEPTRHLDLVVQRLHRGRHPVS